MAVEIAAMHLMKISALPEEMLLADVDFVKSAYTSSCSRQEWHPAVKLSSK